MPHGAEAAAGERQISVDPISVRESEDGDYMRTNACEVVSLPLNNFLGKLMSCSLPNSPNKKFKNKEEEEVKGRPMARQRSVALSNLERLRQSHLQRSKSCGEGRLCQPSLDFDLCSTTTTTATIKNKNENKEEAEADEQEAAATQEEEEEEMVFHKKGGETYEEKFKCGACMFLPGFGKGKAVKGRKEEVPEPEPEQEPEPERRSVVEMVSHRASLEKFECGSWRSSAVMNYDEYQKHKDDDSYDDDDNDPSNLFFDLPVELIRCSSVNDTESPVTTGFTFDNKDHYHPKGVLKNAARTKAGGNANSNNNVQSGRKSNESCNSSSRHVRFSTSSPTAPTSPTSPCITPRLLKPRDDFTAFLEAQSA